MSGESNPAVAIATPVDGLKHLALVFDQREAKPELIAPCTRG